MYSRKLAIIAAASLMVASTAAVAQKNDTSTPTKSIGTVDDGQGSDLLVILGAIALAALITVLATQIGNDDPASP